MEIVIELLSLLGIIAIALVVRKLVSFIKLPAILGWLITGIASTMLVSINVELANIISGTICAAAIINEIIAVILVKIAFKAAHEIP